MKILLIKTFKEVGVKYLRKFPIITTGKNLNYAETVRSTLSYFFYHESSF